MCVLDPRMLIEISTNILVRIDELVFSFLQKYHVTNSDF